MKNPFQKQQNHLTRTFQTEFILFLGALSSKKKTPVNFLFFITKSFVQNNFQTKNLQVKN